MQKRVSVNIIIPVFGNVVALNKLLISIKNLKKNKNITVKTTVINDGGDKIKKITNLKNLKVLNLKKNKGQTFCRNLGAKKSKSDYLWFLDSDTLISNNQSLLLSINLINSYKNVALSGAYENFRGKNFYLVPFVYPNNISVYRKFRFNIIKNIYDGNSLFISRKNFNKVGQFSTDLKVYEELEWSIRAKKKGIGFLFFRDFFVFHSNVKITRNIFNETYLEKILKHRKKILNKHLSKKVFFLPLLDFIFFPIIFFELKVFKKTFSTRFDSYSGLKSFFDYFRSLKVLLISYFRN